MGDTLKQKKMRERELDFAAVVRNNCTSPALFNRF